MKRISILTPCYNEEDNVKNLYEQVKTVLADLPNYEYEHIFIDNASTDKTVEILKSIATTDKNVKLIVNARNFGQVRSGYHGLRQAKGDAVVTMVADLQDPPEMIKAFVKKWEEGYKIVVGIKQESHENRLMFAVRKIYYHFIGTISEVPLIRNFTGFGLYDKKVMDILRSIDDPNPYFRG
ncbi:MAG: glycosyltransferase, partial [Thiotrichaceae bacterium IS1]